MKEQLVAGVDFSGAKTVPNNTWLAVAHVGELGVTLNDVRQVGSHLLAKELAALNGLVACGIDVPFSVPAEFAAHLSAVKMRDSAYQSWQELAQEFVFLTLDEFIEIVKGFKKEPKRFTDKNAGSSAQSPLHRGNPSMVQMTYAGMRMLATLDPEKFVVLPFASARRFAAAVMEVYPRALLQTFGLPASGYKSADKSPPESVQTVRRQIVGGLVSLRERKGISFGHFPRLHVPKKLEQTILASDHALDALLACYATAIFVAAPELFEDPFAGDNEDILLEGWIYNPRKPE